MNRMAGEAFGITPAMFEHMMKNQVEPELAAQRARDQGINVDTVIVTTAPSATGYELKCIDCGRTAHAPFKPDEGKVAMCPSCVKKLLG